MESTKTTTIQKHQTFMKTFISHIDLAAVRTLVITLLDIEQIEL